MTPSRPKTIVWAIGLVAGILAIADHYLHISPQISTYQWELLMGGFILLALGTTFKGM